MPRKKPEEAKTWTGDEEAAEVAEAPEPEAAEPEADEPDEPEVKTEPKDEETAPARALVQVVALLAAMVASWRKAYGGVVRERGPDVDIGIEYGWCPIQVCIRADHADVTTALPLPGVGVLVRNYLKSGEEPPVVSVTFVPQAIVQPVETGKAHDRTLVRYHVTRN